MRRAKVLLFLLFIYACQPTTTVVAPQNAPFTEPATTSSPPHITLTKTHTTTPSATPPSPTDTTIPMTQTSMGDVPLTITVIYDNLGYDSRLETAWGYAALIERDEQRLLFDTGGDGSILLRNMSILRIDPSLIEYVVLSHYHTDHTGGLDALLEMGSQPMVYILPSFPANLKNAVRQKTTPVEVEPGQSIMEGMLSTGELGVRLPEQALIVRTTKGMVIITGCAHPGIVRMVDKAIRLTGDPVYLVMGGFHLGDASETSISSILEDLRAMGVQKVAPSHCTGDRAIDMFREEYEEDFIESGAGRVIVVEP